jgi:hypothetical protein
MPSRRTETGPRYRWSKEAQDALLQAIADVGANPVAILSRSAILRDSTVSIKSIMAKIKNSRQAPAFKSAMKDYYANTNASSTSLRPSADNSVDTTSDSDLEEEGSEDGGEEEREEGVNLGSRMSTGNRNENRHLRVVQSASHAHPKAVFTIAPPTFCLYRA